MVTIEFRQWEREAPFGYGTAILVNGKEIVPHVEFNIADAVKKILDELGVENEVIETDSR